MKLVDADKARECFGGDGVTGAVDRKSTRLNSSHTVISYAVFCLKKKIVLPERPLLISLAVV